MGSTLKKDNILGILECYPNKITVLGIFCAV